MDYKIDSHKIQYHPDVITKLMKKERMVPVNMEISPSGACNLRCKFCSQAFLGYKPDLLDREAIRRSIQSVAGRGLKAVVLAGEGEPLLNPELPNIIHDIYEEKIDIGMSSNALLIDENFAQECLGKLKWIRVSLNAGTSETYNIVHSKPEGFRGIESAFENLAKMVEVKKKNNLKTTIGVQMVLIPDNRDEMVILAKKLEKVGVDYFTIKPFSWHERMNVNFEDYLKMCSFDEVRDELKSLKNDHYQIILRENARKSIENEKCYERCLGLPVWGYIGSNGDVWPCLAYIGVEKYKYGNIYENTLYDIVHSERKGIIDNEMMNMDVSGCRKACRLEAINKYLYELQQLPEHVNFI